MSSIDLSPDYWSGSLAAKYQAEHPDLAERARIEAKNALNAQEKERQSIKDSV